MELRLSKISMILSDVDGVLTDGGIIFDNQGIESKRFHVRDGLGIKLWQRAGFKFGVVTARNSQMVRIRAAELGIDIVRQGYEEKLTAVQQILEENKLEPENLCYIGDDLPDLAPLQYAGLSATVSDAVDEVKQTAHIVLSKCGGQGAVRELVETILKSQQRWEGLIRSYQLRPKH